MCHTCLWSDKLSSTWFASEQMLSRVCQVLIKSFTVLEPAIAIFAVFLGHFGSKIIRSVRDLKGSTAFTAYLWIGSCYQRIYYHQHVQFVQG